VLNFKWNYLINKNDIKTYPEFFKNEEELEEAISRPNSRS